MPSQKWISGLIPQIANQNGLTGKQKAAGRFYPAGGFLF
jgi:hypothetical protein